MERFYKAIEEKIRMSGYTKEISGEDIFDDICDQIEEQDNGTYILLSKFDDDLIFEYTITIMDEEFNLERIKIKSPEGEFEAEFD